MCVHAGGVAVRMAAPPDGCKRTGTLKGCALSEGEGEPPLNSQRFMYNLNLFHYHVKDFNSHFTGQVQFGST